MKIRIHETDFAGRPIECTGEFYKGKYALDIVEGMKLNPFNGHLDPVSFMRQTLGSVGDEKTILSDDPDQAANLFLQRLTALGFARFELEDDELIADNPESGSEPEVKGA